jgi:hypothetical protein
MILSLVTFFIHDNIFFIIIFEKMLSQKSKTDFVEKNENIARVFRFAVLFHT